MKKKAVVLLSGGIDSTTCLALATNLYGSEKVFALNIFYGQKHERELAAAQNVAKYYHVQMLREDLSEVFKFSDCTLLQGRGDIPHEAYAAQTNGVDPVSTYVPFRNGLFLSYAAAIALSYGASDLYYGAHADDAAGAAYPDCSEDFVKYMGQALREGSGGKLTLFAPFIKCNKAEVVKQGLEMHVPYYLTWSCYEGGNEACGVCGTCRDRLTAFKANGVEDPIQYESYVKVADKGEE